MTGKRRKKLLFLLPAAVFLAGLALLTGLWQRLYQRASYEQTEAFCSVILENYPELEEELSQSLKAYQAGLGENAGFLKQYGYEIRDFGENEVRDMLLLTLLTGVLGMAFFLLCFVLADKKKNKRLLELTRYLERVNLGETGTLVQTREDEYSGLQDEIYKTVTKLYVTREEALKAKKSFADNLANIAHQLKTPLTAADLSLQLMERNAGNPYIEPVRRQIGRLNRLEEALLTLSKIDAGTLELKRESVDVYTVLCLASENLRELFDRAGVRTVIPDRGRAEFLGDLEWTMEALMNLLKNCMEHSPEGGTIFCDYTANPLYVEIRMWDQGTGFAPEDLPHLFERFYRGKNAAPDGAGIGLALAYSIFSLQNGSLTARNHPDGGACFEIRLYYH